MGPHRKPGDNLRHWLHSVSNPGNPNVLWNAIAGIRTEAEWDDHGEEYAHSWDGPDVWSVVQVPEGEWLLSLYFFNPNGHENRNGYRDFLLELRKGNDIRMSGKHPEIGGTSSPSPSSTGAGSMISPDAAVGRISASPAPGRSTSGWPGTGPSIPY